MTSNEDLTSATEIIKAKSGYVDFLVVNSGILTEKHNAPPAGAETDLKVLGEYLMSRSQDEWARAFSINSTAPFYTTAAFLELLGLGNKKREGSGKPTSQVLITSSLAGFLRTMPLTFTYSASKASVTHLAKMFATYFIKYDIRVNLLCPGIV